MATCSSRCTGLARLGQERPARAGGTAPRRRPRDRAAVPAPGEEEGHLAQGAHNHHPPGHIERVRPAAHGHPPTRLRTLNSRLPSTGSRTCRRGLLGQPETATANGKAGGAHARASDIRRSIVHRSSPARQGVSSWPSRRGSPHPCGTATPLASKARKTPLVVPQSGRTHWLHLWTLGTIFRQT